MDLFKYYTTFINKTPTLCSLYTNNIPECVKINYTNQLKLMFKVRFSIRAGCTTLCNQVCQWLATGRWISPGPPVGSTNKTDCHDIAEILLKVVLNTIIPNQTNNYFDLNFNWLKWKIPRFPYVLTSDNLCISQDHGFLLVNILYHVSNNACKNPTIGRNSVLCNNIPLIYHWDNIREEVFLNADKRRVWRFQRGNQKP